MTDPNTDHTVFRELFDQLERLSHKIDKLASRVESLAVLDERTANNTSEIRILRDRHEEMSKQIVRLEARITQPVNRDDAGVLKIKPAVLTIVVAVAGFVLNGVWNIIQFIFDLAKGGKQ